MGTSFVSFEWMVDGRRKRPGFYSPDHPPPTPPLRSPPGASSIHFISTSHTLGLLPFSLLSFEELISTSPINSQYHITPFTFFTFQLGSPLPPSLLLDTRCSFKLHLPFPPLLPPRPSSSPLLPLPPTTLPTHFPPPSQHIQRTNNPLAPFPLPFRSLSLGRRRERFLWLFARSLRVSPSFTTFPLRLLWEACWVGVRGAGLSAGWIRVAGRRSGLQARLVPSSNGMGGRPELWSPQLWSPLAVESQGSGGHGSVPSGGRPEKGTDSTDVATARSRSPCVPKEIRQSESLDLPTKDHVSDARVRPRKSVLASDVLPRGTSQRRRRRARANFREFFSVSRILSLSALLYIPVFR